RRLLPDALRGVLPRPGLGRVAARRDRVAVGGRALGALPPARAGGAAAPPRGAPGRDGRRPDRAGSLALRRRLRRRREEVRALPVRRSLTGRRVGAEAPLAAPARGGAGAARASVADWAPRRR